MKRGALVRIHSSSSCWDGYEGRVVQVRDKQISICLIRSPTGGSGCSGYTVFFSENMLELVSPLELLAREAE